MVFSGNWNIFITGIGGALGSTLAKTFYELGHGITGNDIKSPEDVNLPEVDYLWKATEDLSMEDLDLADIVINCAATADRPMGISSPIHTIHNNVNPTLRLLELCRRLGRLTKFIQAGSGTVYSGLPDDKLPATEQTVPEPRNPYSASKYMQDILCLTYYRAYGVPVIILRSGMVYGAGRLAIAPHRFILQVLQDLPVTVYGGSQTRTPTHILDVLEFWKSIVEYPTHKCVGRIFHTVYGVEYNILDIANRVLRMIMGTGSWIDRRGYEVGEEDQEGRPTREWIVSKTANELGVVPKVDLDMGLRLTLKWIEGVA